MDKKRFLALLLIFVCILVYSNSLSGPFISDDISAIARNPKLLRPLLYWDSPPMLLNSLDYFLGRHNPFFYHLTNILLHSLNTLLIFFLLKLLFGIEASFLGALIFAVHPIHAEAVSWVSGRPYLLMAFFMLSNLLLYNSAQGSRRGLKWAQYLACLLIFLYTIIPANSYHYYLFPFLILLLDITLRRWRCNWRLWVPFFAIAALKLIILRGELFQRAYSLARGSGMQEPAWNNPFLTLAHSLFSNFALILWPARLTLYHEPVVASNFLLLLESMLTLALFLALPFIFFKKKTLFFGAAIFIMPLAHTFSPIPLSWMIAERYLYLPSLSLSVFAAFFYEKFALKGVLPRKAALSAILLVVSLFALRTVIRNEDWSNPGRFWRQALKASPGSVSVHIKMGDVYAGEGNFDEAVSELDKAIALKPRDPIAYNNLGNAYAQMGMSDKAISAYLNALKSDPGFAEAYFNLGNLSLASGKKEETVSYYLKAVGIKPDIPEFYLNLGVAYEGLGRMDSAIDAYKKSLVIYPHFSVAHNNLAVLYYRKKEYALAVKHCELALKYGYEVNPQFLASLKPYRGY